MLKSAPVFALPVLDHWLVHSPLQDVSALTNRAAVDAMSDGASLPELGLDEPPEPEPRPRTGPLHPRFLGLVPTRACNLACAYCGFGARPEAAHMDPQLACAAVDWMADHVARTGGEALGVHFFGGEPLMAPKVVEASVERARTRAAQLGVPARLGVVTNGAYSEECARFVGDAFEQVVLSLDGFASIQERHRPRPGGRGTFETVCRTARVLGASRAELFLRVCVAEDNVGMLPEIAEWFCREFRPAAIDFETLRPTPESVQAGLQPPDPYLFAERFEAALRVAAGYGVRTVYAATDADRPRLTICPVGDDVLIVHPDGTVSACYLMERDWQARGLHLNLGRMERDGHLALDHAALAAVRELVGDKPRCRNCFCRWRCAGGCHVSQSFPGCSKSYDNFCVGTRLIAACALLRSLGGESLVHALVADLDAMRRLATQPSDRVAHEFP